jgi:Fe-S cluster assembly scaffold protein SufB
MRSVRSANYLQVNHEIRRVFAEEGVIVRSSSEAYKEFGWTMDYFEHKPEEGYFIWIKNPINHPLTTCIAISSPKVSQNPRNLVVIEENVEVEINSVCNTVKKDLCGSHVGRSKVVLKENSGLKMRHFHKWGGGDVVGSSLEFSVGKGARLFHTYRCLAVPEKLETENNTLLDSHSSANSEVAVLAKDSHVDIHDSTFLNGERSSGISRLRMIADENSTIFAHSKMVANAVGTGHLDCMGLLLAEESSINAVPELLNKNKDAMLTHEASVGKISEEVLSYLRSRGLTGDEAIDLIVAGFLSGEAPFTYEGRVLPSKIYM